MDVSSERESPINGSLPPMISGNPREKILSEEVPASEIIKSRKEKNKADVLEPEVSIPKPAPSSELTIAWYPELLLFEVKEEPIVQKLTVWNSSTRSIYVHCCELWDETAYLGARWRCYPQTRFLLAPGLTAVMFVRASPKEVSPVPCANAKLQLAASYKRDPVVGYFAVTVNVKFLNHIPYSGEGGE